MELWAAGSGPPTAACVALRFFCVVPLASFPRSVVPRPLMMGTKVAVEMRDQCVLSRGGIHAGCPSYRSRAFVDPSPVVAPACIVANDVEGEARCLVLIRPAGYCSVS